MPSGWKSTIQKYPRYAPLKQKNTVNSFTLFVLEIIYLILKKHPNHTL